MESDLLQWISKSTNVARNFQRTIQNDDWDNRSSNEIPDQLKLRRRDDMWPPRHVNIGISQPTNSHYLEKNYHDRCVHVKSKFLGWMPKDQTQNFFCNGRKICQHHIFKGGPKALEHLGDVHGSKGWVIQSSLPHHLLLCPDPREIFAIYTYMWGLQFPDLRLHVVRFHRHQILISLVRWLST